jgi:tRNA modification GTPase
VIDSGRQKQALEKAQAALLTAQRGIESNVSFDLVAADLREAIDALGLVTGEVTSAEILEEMFSKFCVGK